VTVQFCRNVKRNNISAIYCLTPYVRFAIFDMCRRSWMTRENWYDVLNKCDKSIHYTQSNAFK